jgi:hypothetical protein
MSMSWAGVIGSALAGGAAGAMGSAAKDIDEQQKAAIQAKRDAALAALARENQIAVARAGKEMDLEYAPKMAAASEEAAAAAAPAKRQRAADDAKAAADAKEESDNKHAKSRREREVEDTKAKEGAKNRVLSAGQAEYGPDGKLIVKNEDKAGDEQKRASARNSDAAAEEHRARAKKVGEGADPDNPKPRNDQKFDWKEHGRNTWVDSVTGVTKTVIPKVEAKKGEWRAFKENDPDTPEVPAREVYTYGGKEISFDEVQALRASKSGKSPGVVNSTTRPPTSSGAALVPGKVVAGFRFKGGDKRDPKNWEQV